MDNVKVAVRIRPMVSSELKRGCQEAIVRTPGEPQVSLNGESFTYNYVFDASDSQEKVFMDAVLPMLDKLHCGFNVTILAYGQTGSGKTHTMGTAFNGLLNEDAGVIPRAMQFIFDKVKDQNHEYTFEIKCSFLELYQEQLFDLLSEKGREMSMVEIREDKNGICMPDLTYETVNSTQQTTNCLMRGSTRRAVASTAMNENSSRSHAIFTVFLTSIKKDESQGLTTAKFHLVDLAGSERSNKTMATGDRFKEGVKINHGLLALGNVISALGSEKNAGFVRYRDSKLTRLLQDSLGGNSITLMIACVSPADYNMSETMGTLRYADRARKIKNRPIVNQDPHAAEVNNLKSIIHKLRMELLTVKGGSDLSLDSLSSGPIASPRRTCNDKMYRELQEKYRNLQKQLQKTLQDVVENEMRMHIAEAAHEKLKAKTDELRIVADELVVDMETAEAETETETKMENEAESGSGAEAEAEAHVRLHCEKVKRMVQMVININDELERTTIEMNEHKQQSVINSETNSDDEGELGEEGGAEIEKEAENYNNKQFNIREQLTRINNELNIKEQLQQRIAINLNKFCTLDENMEAKLEECQMKIRVLEDERSELLDKLNHVKEHASARLAEDRRKRLQALESEINAMKQKMKQQSNLLKVREKEAQKIQNLSRDIQAMKESKVKLIRTMRREAENFRQWKLTREKELLQMKNKGRKMENEMARKEALHSKQRNVLKRKCEEAMAINKRLKDALERQSVAQSMRQKSNYAKDNIDKRSEQVQAIVERELEVITSLIDAEQSLEHLMEDRGIINRRIADLKKNEPESQELKQLYEEYEMRNAQITELQQKVCAADLDERMRGLCDCMQNMAEARAVAKQFINTIIEKQREFASLSQEQKVALDEKCSQLQVSREEHQTATKRLKLLEKEHRDGIIAIERTYEEKIALLLGELHSKATAIKGDSNTDAGDGFEPTTAQKECVKIEEDLLSKMESMREEIDYYKQLVATLDKKKNKNPKIKVIEELQQHEVEVVDSPTTDDDRSDDPDWKMSERTPWKRKRSQISRRNNALVQSTISDASANADETYVTATSEPNGSVMHPPPKRRGCKCRNFCKSRMCGCRAANLTCDNNCRCGDRCLIDKPNISNPTNDDSKENFVNSTELLSDKPSVSESTFVKPPEPQISSDEKAKRLACLTTINFDTPTSKKKFFPS